MLKSKIRQAIIELQKQYPQKRSALIPALLLAQKQEGYLSLEIEQEVAALFEIDQTEVHGVVTFYDMLFDKPVGKHLVHICKNVSCMLRGADTLLEQVSEKLQCKPGQTTKDGNYTILPSECLGACDRAPMILLDSEVFGPVKETDLDQILKI